MADQLGLADSGPETAFLATHDKPSRVALTIEAG
jgi:hypothetical protein